MIDTRRSYPIPAAQPGNQRAFKRRGRPQCGNMQPDPSRDRMTDRKPHLSDCAESGIKYVPQPADAIGRPPCNSIKWLNAKTASVTHIGVDASTPTLMKA